MLVIGMEFLSTMALVAAVSVLINVLLALTLLPALLGLVGEKSAQPKPARRVGLPKASKTTASRTAGLTLQ